MQLLHQRSPHGRCAAGAAHVPHGRAAGVAHPHAHGVAAAEAHGPVVAHVLAGAGFHGAPEAGGEQRIGAEGGGTRLRVAQDVADNESGARIQRLGGAWPGAGREGDGRHAAQVGERAVGVGQVGQRDLGAAQGQAVAVIAAGLAQVETQRVELPRQCVRRDHGAGAHRRHVERRGQRGAHADPALELAVVVLRDVQAAGGLQVGRRIVQQRGGGEALFGNRLGVQEGLERAAGLAPAGRHVDLRGVAQVAGGADPGQHLAAGVVEHHHGAVFDVLPPQFLHVLLQGL